jgi:hypothetical protein
MPGSPRKRARRAGLPVSTGDHSARAPAPPPARAPARADPKALEKYEKRQALLEEVLAHTCDPVTNPDGAADDLLRRFFGQAMLDGDVSAAKLVLDVFDARTPTMPSLERARSAIEMLEAVRAALPELEAKARAEAEAAGTVTPDTVAVDEGRW